MKNNTIIFKVHAFGESISATDANKECGPVSDLTCRTLGLITYWEKAPAQLSTDSASSTALFLLLFLNSREVNPCFELSYVFLIFPKILIKIALCF